MKKEIEAEAVPVIASITKFFVVLLFSPLLFLYFLGTLAWVFLAKDEK
jgi:hypothetical protein